MVYDDARVWSWKLKPGREGFHLILVFPRCGRDLGKAEEEFVGDRGKVACMA